MILTPSAMCPGRLTLCWLLVAVAGFAACATPEAARRAAALTANSANNLKREMTGFVEQADRMRTANDEELQRLTEYTLALRVDARNASLAWQVAEDERAIAMYTALTTPPVNDVTSASVALTLLMPASEGVKTRFDPARFNALVKRLSDLAAEADFADTMAGLFEYGTRVRGLLEADMEKSRQGLPATRTNVVDTITDLVNR